MRVAFTPELSALPLEVNRPPQDDDAPEIALFTKAAELKIVPMLKLRMSRLSLSIQDGASQGWDWGKSKSETRILMRSRGGNYTVAINAEIREVKPDTLGIYRDLTISGPDKSADESGNRGLKERSDKRPASAKSESSDRVLLDQMLHRFGELQGAIVLEMDNEELELVRFGRPKNSK